jgi:hypothetical protein
LRQRGVVEPNASLIAEMGLAIFKVGFERWVDDARRRDLPQNIRDALSSLKEVTASARSPRARRQRSRSLSTGR